MGPMLAQENPKGGRPRVSVSAGGMEEVFSTNNFSKAAAEPRWRFGDLLPLPLPQDAGYDGSLGMLGSRRAQQRVVKRRTLLRREAETVRSLNHLAGFDDESSWPKHPLNFSQKSALHRVHHAHFQRAPPVDHETDKAALLQLLRGRAASGYFSSPAAGAVVPYEVGAVSLPKDQQELVSLSSLLPPLEQERLANFNSEMMLGDEEIAAVLEKGLEGDMYVDPRLAEDKKVYHSFIGELVQSNLVGFTTRPRSQVGLFFVSKKSGKLRMIIDARRTNKLFRKPPSTQLGSTDAWCRAEVAEQGELFFAQEDVKDFFYRLRIPQALGEYFCLPLVDPILLKEQIGYIPHEMQNIIDQSTAPIYPYLRVLPMGFSWAFHLAHESHSHLARQTLPSAGILVDRKTAPVLGGGGPGTGMLIYADNNNHFGQCASQVAEDQRDMIHALHMRGLATHEIAEPSTLAESLGVRLNGSAGVISSTAVRDWRLHRALGAIINGGFRITGEELRVVIGHMTMRAMLNRQLMGILRHCYVFVQKSFLQDSRFGNQWHRNFAFLEGSWFLGLRTSSQVGTLRSSAPMPASLGMPSWSGKLQLSRQLWWAGLMSAGVFVEEKGNK